jgi:biopolymer transport protein ExbD
LIADADATHQSVVTAMDGIGQSGFTRLNIATQRPQEFEQLEQSGSTPADQL